MEKKVYIIGHRNPDTDSVVSVAAYARLKQLQGHDNYLAARAGKINPQIDHHRLGNLSTRYPIIFINRVVGATCTIIANLYREQKIPLEKDIAAILLCGILADTLALQSATVTETELPIIFLQ